MSDLQSLSSSASSEDATEAVQTTGTGNTPLLVEEKVEDRNVEAESAEEKPKEAEENNNKPPKVSVLTVFRFRDTTDTVLICIGSIFAVLQGILAPLNMLIMGNMVNSIGYGVDLEKFNTVIYDMVGLMFAGLVFGMLNAGSFEIASERQVHRLKKEFLKGVLRQEMAYFDEVDTGSLASRIEQTCVHVRDGTGLKFGLLFQFTSQFIGGYVVGLIRGWKMALVLTAVIPLLGGTVGVTIVQIRKQIEISKREYEKAGSVAEEALPVMRTVQSFAAEDPMITRFEGHLESCTKSEIRGALFKAIGFCAMMGFLFLSYALGWWYAGKTVADAYLAQYPPDLYVGGDCLTVFFCIIVASFSVGQLMPNVNSFVLAGKSVISVHEVIDRVSAVDPYDESGLRLEEPLQGKIEFKHIKFAFPARPDRMVYEDVSFTINSGETVALVGPSGCGKSTIIQMIERFYNPNGGVIEVDGRPISEYNLNWLRQNMALVSQEPRLFAESISRNIGYGKEGSSQEEIEEAAKRANAHKFIESFQEGYATNVGEGGSLLSGGQKQRVAIARAILRDPAILILDEATSALDNESEKVVQEALDDLVKLKKRTTIVIAHRLSTIRTADRIIVIDNPTGFGSVVVEQGRHEELLQIEGGLYRALVTAQTAIADKDPGAAGEVREELERNEAIENLARKFSKTNSKVPADVQKSSSVAKMLRKYSKGGSADGVEDDFETRLRQSVSKQSIEGKKKKGWKFWKKSDAETAAEFINAPGMDDIRIRDLFGYMREDWWILALGCLSAVFTGGSFPLVSVLISKFLGVFFHYIGDETQQENADYVTYHSNRLAVAFVVFACVIAVAQFGQQYSFGIAGENLVDRMRKLTFQSMMYQDMEFFDDPTHNTGTLSAVLSADCSLVKGITGDNLAIIVQNGMTFIIACVISFASCWKLAAVGIVVFGLMVPANFLQVRNMKVSTVRPDAINNEESAGFVLNEAITSLRTVAAYNLQGDIVERYDTVLEKEYQTGRRNAVITGVVAGVASCVMFMASLVSFKYGGTLMEHGEPGLGVESLMRTVMSLMFAGNGISRNTAFATDSKKAKAAGKSILSILNRTPKINCRDPAGSRQPLDGRVEFDKMIFRYPTRPETPILKEITFEVKCGETVALVGESGCGKSTIIQLLERFYDLSPSNDLRVYITNRNRFIEKEEELGRHYQRLGSATNMYGGEVRVDGQGIEEYNIAHLRSQLGLVSQEPALFDETVLQNVRWGKPDATEDEVVEALKLANAYNFISKMPLGLLEIVGKGGNRLSGGQKQRVAIARAIIRNPKILLLDEATSALDPESEEVVQKALDELMQTQKRTTIVIAHRLTTIRNADKIVVFVPHPGVGSTIVEQGNHDALMQVPNGVYRKLVELSQTKGSSQ